MMGLAEISERREEWKEAARACVIGFISPAKSEPVVVGAIAAVMEVVFWEARASAFLEVPDNTRKGDATKPPEACGE